jgi:imidazolonepropionase-like amidohydrolase
MPKDRAENLALAALTSGGTAAGDVAIRSGSRADLVVWSADPLKDPQAKPVWVIVAGVAMRMILE